jgi:uncharacterized small protein (DUF1192 family)
MDWDDVRPATGGDIIVGENLERLSVGELEVRIAALESEVQRVRGELEKKRAHGEEASALFKLDDD